MGNSKLKDITLRITRVKGGSKDEMILGFARSRELMPMRQLVLSTLKMCWLPFAYQQQGADDETQQQAAREAVYQLQHHLHYLLETFDLESVSIGKETTTVTLPVTEASEPDEPPGEYDLGGLEFGS